MEHSYGLDIESTDNPGRLATLSGVPLCGNLAYALSLSASTNVQGKIDAEKSRVEIWSPDLSACLLAVSSYLDLCREQTSREDGEDGDALTG